TSRAVSARRAAKAAAGSSASWIKSWPARARSKSSIASTKSPPTSPATRSAPSATARRNRRSRSCAATASTSRTTSRPAANRRPGGLRYDRRQRLLRDRQLDLRAGRARHGRLEEPDPERRQLIDQHHGHRGAVPAAKCAVFGGDSADR